MKYSRDYLSGIQSLLYVLQEIERRLKTQLIGVLNNAAESLRLREISSEYTPRTTSVPKLSNNFKESSNMVFTIDFLPRFLKQLTVFSNACEELDPKGKKDLSDKKAAYEMNRLQLLEEYRKSVYPSVSSKTYASVQYESKLRELSKQEESWHNSLYTRISQCKDVLASIDSMINEFSKQNSSYDTSGNSYKNSHSGDVTFAIDRVIIEMKSLIDSFTIAEIASAKNNKPSKGFIDKCTNLYNYSSQANKSINDEIEHARAELFANEEKIKQERDSLWKEYQNSCVKILQDRDIQQERDKKITSHELTKLSDVLKDNEREIQVSVREKINAEVEEFTKKFNPAEIREIYAEIYAAEPFVENYQCKKVNPASVNIAALTYDLSTLSLGKHAKILLESHYPALYRHGKLNIPFCLTFDNRFNYLFEVNAKNRDMIVNKACSLAMRLFMMLPPNKVNFTFIDPITLGETFALFTRLVDVDDRTSKVINGKIWTSTADVDDRLRVLTDHISNVTQRCLQGQYDNIQDYNAIAGQNAEPYQILMIMDFPGSFKEDSLRMLEQIISTGSKCGVYTVILKSDEQIAKTDSKLKPLINNIETKTMRFVVKENKVVLGDINFNGNDFQFFIKPLLSADELNAVIPKLKDGIKNAEKIVINFDERKEMLPDNREWFKGDCSSELVIPLGIHGANNVQNLTFGIGGHHALIAGQTGSGKSSLLHTIIMSALLRYSADQLHIFLVDFKRGVEFKIYANHKLEAFRAVAIESEREFGSSVLDFLDKEQSRRADKFKRENVDNVHDYRQKTGEVLPRILLIIDEFHVLFSKDNDIMSKNAADHLEQIIRQGRAFGLHVILASQTMTNVGGIHHGLWGQVGIRIALKCPKADARFVLGPDNDAVDLLSPNDPGQAVYNSDCGSIIANTIFRVAYIEQERQTNLLDEISSLAPKLKQSVPETRVMISNVEDNIYNPFQRFARGEQVEFVDNSVLVGESLQLFSNMRMTFKAKASSNMLIVGYDEQKACTMFTFCSLSLALHALTKNNNKKPCFQCIYIVDYAPMEDFYEKDIMLELVKLLPDYVKYVNFEDSGEVLEELYLDLSARKKGSSSNESKYFLLFGLQRARDLRSNDPYQNVKYENMEIKDDLGLDIQQKLSVTPYDMFLNILQSGAANNIHSIIWVDNFKTFMAYYSGMLLNFDLRIGFTMADDDSILFIEEPNGSQISENNAVFSYNGNQKFRPYKKPDFNWLHKICERINSFL